MRIDQLKPGQKFKADWLENKGIKDKEPAFVGVDGDGDAWFSYIGSRAGLNVPFSGCVGGHREVEPVPEVVELTCKKLTGYVVPEGWYELGPDDVVQQGDKFKSDPAHHKPLNEQEWFTTSNAIGQEVSTAKANRPHLYFTFIRKKPKDYATRQAEWIKRHNIKIGSKVKVLRAWSNESEDGYDFGCHKAAEMVGRIDTVEKFHNASGKPAIKGTWHYPYFVLEPLSDECKVPDGYEQLGPDDIVREDDCAVWLDGVWGTVGNCPRGHSGQIHGAKASEVLKRYDKMAYVVRKLPVAPKLVPFDKSDDLIGVKVIRKRGEFKSLITGQSNDTLIVGGLGGYNYPALLDKFTMFDGSPCGKWV